MPLRSTGLIIGLIACSTVALSVEPTPSPTPAAAAKPKWQRLYPQVPPGITQFTEVVAAYPEHTVTVTIYVPDAPGTYPAILDIHGGGWAARQIEQDKPMMERLAARGFVTALVAYRLSGEAPYPAALADCKSALRFLRTHAARFKIDPARIGCMGGSAGGHLSGLVGMTSGLEAFEGDGPWKPAPSTVQACIVMAATQDFVAAYRDKPTPASVAAFFGGNFTERTDVFTAASPITHVRPGVPPTIFIEGEKDSLKIGRAEMQEKLRAVGVETALHTLPDAPHPFWMSQPWCDQTVEIASAFFKKHLGEPTTP